MNDCDACAGQGNFPNCMCGGTGHATDAVIYLRDRVIELEKRIDLIATELCKYGDADYWTNAKTFDIASRLRKNK